jgi:peptidoglycan-associated lipoprotein
MFRSTIVCLALGLAAVGCSKQQEPATPASTPAAPASVAPKAATEAVAKAVETNEGGGLTFSPDIIKLCPGVRSPKFGFDSAALRDQWTDALQTLSSCMKSGGLAGKSLVLTGHTDPRGEEDYNMALGGRRAGSVKDALAAFGIDGGRLSTTSRGEAEAKGTDEATWTQDRRVDIDLRR